MLGDELISQWLEYLNSGSRDLITSTFSPDYEDHHPFPGYAGTLAATIQAADDRLRDERVTVSFELDDSLSAADRVAYRISGWGSRRDETNSRTIETFMLASVGIFRIEAGFLRERWGLWGYMPLSREE